MSRQARHHQAQLARERAVADARYLALEYAGLRPHPVIDVASAGFVLQHQEFGIRHLPATLSQFDAQLQLWSPWYSGNILITNHRLLVRGPNGATASLWWASVVSVQIDPGSAYVILDYGDDEPRAIGGPATPTIAVAAVATTLGVETLLTHPALARLRQASQYTRQNAAGRQPGVHSQRG